MQTNNENNGQAGPSTSPGGPIYESSIEQNMAARDSSNNQRDAEDAIENDDMPKRRRTMEPEHEPEAESSSKDEEAEEDEGEESSSDESSSDESSQESDSDTTTEIWDSDNSTTISDSDNSTLISSSDSDSSMSTQRHNGDFYEVSLASVLGKLFPASRSSLENRSQMGAALNSLTSVHDLPAAVEMMFKTYRGVTSLHDWQHACLSMAHIWGRKNLLYVIPTVGGKTIIMDVLILREILSNKKNVLLILHFGSMVREKVWALSEFAVSLGFMIQEYAGGKGTYPPRKSSRKNVLYIATIEKASNLVNSLIATGQLDELGLVVIDDVHLIGMGLKGTILETVITKLLYLQGTHQIIAMSASVLNNDQIAVYLNAIIFGGFAPVSLREFVTYGSFYMEVNPSATDTENVFIDRTAHTLIGDDDEIIEDLVAGAIPQQSCLVFCSENSLCAPVADMICDRLPSNLMVLKAREKSYLIRELDRGVVGPDSIQRKAIRYGVAYYHDDLPANERRLIEMAYKTKILCAICCCWKLGGRMINLRTDRVIIRCPDTDDETINITFWQYKQMALRAEYIGNGDGESILVVSPSQVEHVKTMLLSPWPRCRSRLLLNHSLGLCQLILSCMVLKIVKNRDELKHLVKTTFMYVRRKRRDDLDALIDTALQNLMRIKAIKLQESEEDIGGYLTDISLSCPDANDGEEPHRLVVTPLAHAIIRCGLDLVSTRTLDHDLQQAQDAVLDRLHLLYLMVDYKTAKEIDPNAGIYHGFLKKLNQHEWTTARNIGINATVFRKMNYKDADNRSKSVSQSDLNRFYLAMMLHELWKGGEDVYSAGIKYQLSRRVVENLVSKTISFASNVINFCDQIGNYLVFSDMLKGVIKRLGYYGIHEVRPLMELPLMNESRAVQLYKVGFQTIRQISEASDEDLMSNVEFMSKREANQLIAVAKMNLLQKADSLEGEISDVLDL